MTFIIIYVTHKNLEDAQKIAFHLLKRKFISCVNFFPIKSAYWWKDKIENSKEVVSLLKTKKGNWEKVKSEIKK